MSINTTSSMTNFVSRNLYDSNFAEWNWIGNIFKDDPDNNNSSLRRALATPRLIERGVLYEAGLRGALVKVREQGWASLSTGLVPGMAGLGVPVFDADRQVVATRSVGALAERLNADRIPFVAQILQREALSLAARLNPFDVSLRYPSRSSSIFGSLKA